MQNHFLAVFVMTNYFTLIIHTCAYYAYHIECLSLCHEFCLYAKKSKKKSIDALSYLQVYICFMGGTLSNTSRVNNVAF